MRLKNKQKQSPHLVYLAIELHHLGRLHEFLLEGAADPLPVSAFPAVANSGRSEHIPGGKTASQTFPDIPRELCPESSELSGGAESN